MNEVSFSYYQVIIVFLFLLSLILAHFYVRKHKTSLTGKFGNSKYIQVLEDLNISPSEKIRLIKVGSEFIFLASAKGAPTSIELLEGLSQKKGKASNIKNPRDNLSIPMSKSSKQENTRQQDSIELGKAKGYGGALKTAIQQARKMNPHVSF
ncbi:MAG: flagellar biosynthetic protein FliO [Paracoccaceae bacterium]|tara:strand:- start:120 stop:575 length:456 start_codon:yes stop_codon:yes gene_type:complete